MTTRKVNVSDELVSKIKDTMRGVNAEIAAASLAQGEVEKESRSLESAQADVTTRIAALSAAAINDDDAAGELSKVERRATAIRLRLDQLRKNPMPKVDLSQVYETIFDIVNHWRAEVSRLIIEAVEPFGMDESAIRPLMGNFAPFAVLNNISNWLSVAPGPSRANVDRFLAIMDAALAGQLDLSRRAVKESASEIAQEPS